MRYLFNQRLLLFSGYGNVDKVINLEVNCHNLSIVKIFIDEVTLLVLGLERFFFKIDRALLNEGTIRPRADMDL